MIDTLPLSNVIQFPHVEGGVISCVFCGFAGAPMFDLPDRITNVTRASFRYVNDIKNPTEGVCGRYECRMKLAKQANKQFNTEVDRRFKIQFERVPTVLIPDEMSSD